MLSGTLTLGNICINSGLTQGFASSPSQCINKICRCCGTGRTQEHRWLLWTSAAPSWGVLESSSQLSMVSTWDAGAEPQMQGRAWGARSPRYLCLLAERGCQHIAQHFPATKGRAWGKRSPDATSPPPAPQDGPTAPVGDGFLVYLLPKVPGDHAPVSLPTQGTSNSPCFCRALSSSCC